MLFDLETNRKINKEVWLMIGAGSFGSNLARYCCFFTSFSFGLALFAGMTEFLNFSKV
jgi:hypothetical protein